MINYAIKDNAMDYIRYVSINDNRAANSYNKWFEASKKAPSQGLHIMRIAEWSRLNQIIEDLQHDHLSIDEYTNRAMSLIKDMYNRMLGKDTADLAKSVKETYPQTYAKRLAIISECEDDFWGKVKLAKNKKTSKKFYTSLFKFLVK